MLILFDITAVAFLLSLLLTPVVREGALRLGLVDEPDSDRKRHHRPIPRVGGVAVAVAYVAGLALIAIAPYRVLTIDLGRGIAASLALAPAALLIFAVGLADDLLNLRPWHKLVGQVAAALWAHAAGFGVHAFRGEPLSDWISIPISVLWLVGCTNALNLIDGMDGLASGVGVFATMTCLVAALVHGSVELAIVTAPLVGALLGFLRYNFNPASIFLGDCGSLLIGFLLGCYGATWSNKAATVLGMTAPLLALAMPLLDTGLAVARRFLRGQPIMSADRAHIHHRLLDQGLTPRRAALVLYAFCGLGALFAIVQDLSNDQFGGLIVILFCGGAWLGLQHLGYSEFGVTSRLIFRGAFRKMVGAQLRLQQLERDLDRAPSLDAVWRILVEQGREMGWVGVRLRLGETFLESGPAPAESASLWQVRLPLPPDGFLNLLYDPVRGTHPLLFATFPEIAERHLRGRQPGAHRSMPSTPAETPPADPSVQEPARGAIEIN